MKNKNFKLIISLFMLFVPIFLLVTSQYGCTKNEDKNVTEKNVEGEVNDTETSKDEDNKDATVYQSGLYNVIVYHHTGKVALMKEGQFVGYLK